MANDKTSTGARQRRFSDTVLREEDMMFLRIFVILRR
jgi:hypothetical protein